MARRGYQIERVPPPFGEEISTRKKSRKISPLDAAVMIIHVAKGKKTADVGFEDADRTYQEIIRALNNGSKTYGLFPDSVIESALWSCNLLDEQGKFEHPLGLKFGDWVKQLLKGDKFDLLYNYIKERK